jgi:hypothetical protein
LEGACRSFDDRLAQAAQIAVIERRRNELQLQAVAIGEKLHRR